MKLGYELTIEQTQKLSMTPELIQAIQILQFNNQELVDYVQNELMENPVLEAEKSYDAQEVDIREKIREADYEEQSFRQWEYAPDDVNIMWKNIIPTVTSFIYYVKTLQWKKVLK